MSKSIANLVLNPYINDNRVYKTSQSLKQAGYDVQIVALLRGDVPEREDSDGVPVHRIKLSTMNLPGGAFFGVIKFIEMVIRMVAGYRKKDIWHCNDFEIFVIGIMAKMTRPKLKLVYDSHEYQAERIGKRGFEKWFVGAFEKLFIHRVSAFITVSYGIAEEYKRRFGVKDPKVVLNAPHYTEVKKSKILREKLNIPDGATLFLYQGGLVVGRGIELLLEVFKHINDPNIHLALMGRGNYEPRIKAAAKRCSSIHFHPAVPYHDLVEYTSSADVGILSIQNLCLSYWYCMPNKLFEYIQARIPILSNNLHDSKMVIEEYNLGVVIPEYTLEALEAGIRELAGQDLSVYQPGLEKAKEEFHWEKEERKLLGVYESV